MPSLDDNNNIVISVQEFREAFPEFSNQEVYTDALISRAITQTACFVSHQNRGSIGFDCRALLIEYAAAHLLTLMMERLNGTGAAGGVGGGASGRFSGIMQHAAIGQVSVSVAIPPTGTQQQYWLNLTPYGQQFLAMLKFREWPVYLPGSHRGL